MADGERRTAAIMVISSASFPASPFGGYTRLAADGAAVLWRRFPAAARSCERGKEVRKGGRAWGTEGVGKGGLGWRSDPMLELGRAAMAVAAASSDGG
jgi:hypothetical protein